MFWFQCYHDLDSCNFSLPLLYKEFNLIALTAGVILVPGIIITNQNCNYILMLHTLAPIQLKFYIASVFGNDLSTPIFRLVSDFHLTEVLSLPSVEAQEFL